MASISIDQLSGSRFKVRWREWVIQPDGSRRRVARSRTVRSKEAAVELQAQILRAVETQGFYEEPARRESLEVNLEQAAAQWLRHKAAQGRAASSVRRYAGSLARWFRAVRRVRGIGDDEVVPGSVLTREVFAGAILQLGDTGLQEGTLYSTARIALDMWTWVADDPHAWPGVRPAPRDKSAVLPQAPIYVAPPAPTLEEVDAVIRRLAKGAYVALGAAIVMRFTGLRVSQALGLKVGDVDLERGTMVVRVGKSRREKAEMRTVPISWHLVSEVSDWVVDKGPTESLIRRRSDLRAPLSRNHLPSRTLSAAWEAATEAGEVRREVWAPPNRKLARPDHAFRAAFQAFLEGARVRDAVIDRLVGHSPRSTRGRHYAVPPMDQLREAVGLLPPIGRVESEDNVIPFRG